MKSCSFPESDTKPPGPWVQLPGAEGPGPDWAREPSPPVFQPGRLTARSAKPSASPGRTSSEQTLVFHEQQLQNPRPVLRPHHQGAFAFLSQPLSPPEPSSFPDSLSSATGNRFRPQPIL